jgi:hypothetical protein
MTTWKCTYCEKTINGRSIDDLMDKGWAKFESRIRRAHQKGQRTILRSCPDPLCQKALVKDLGKILDGEPRVTKESNENPLRMDQDG